VLEFNHINPNYSDFAYRLEEFFQLIDFQDQRLTKLDALLLYSLVRGTRPQRVLEIGRCHGTSTMTISGGLCDNNHGHLDSVDIEDSTDQVIKHLIKNWATTYVLNSNEILQHPTLQRQKYEMFFVDGDHSIPQQIDDIETCLYLGKENCWIVLHDANLVETHRAIDLAKSLHPQLMDAGRLGDQLHLLKSNRTGTVPHHVRG